MESAAAAEKDGQTLVSSPDLRHVTDWIFDLDNTLYRADNGIFAQIEGRMTDYVMRYLKLPRPDAYARQKELYRRHGTTLSGLMREHGAAPEEYLAYVHDVDLSELAPNAALAAEIGKLPGRRFIFTNGCRDHAARVLERLNLATLFDDVWDIRTMGFVPKPEAPAYDSVVAASGVAAKSAAMFDDLARNLVPASKLGMTTVWLKTDSPWNNHGPPAEIQPADIHHQTRDLTQFLQTIRI